MQSFVVATHSFAFGNSQALMLYLKRKGKQVLFIEQPLFANPIVWSIGALDTLWQVVITKKKYDVFIGSNRLNAYLGILLKKIGLVRQVIYYSPDWVEKRFDNAILNKIYAWLDFQCVKEADLIWNSSTIMKLDPMMKMRLKKGYPKSWLKKQIQRPDGCDLFPYIPLSKVDRYKIGFIGHLREGMGGELLIEAFKIIKKNVPQAKLILMGAGPKETALKRESNGIEDIEFTGYVTIDQVYKQLKKCAIAVAPYRASPENMSQFTDPGKVKVYLSVSLPTVITRVPQIAFELNDKKAGIATDDDVDAFSKSCVKLLTDDVMLEEYRKNAYQLAEKYSWDKNFDRALSFL